MKRGCTLIQFGFGTASFFDGFNTQLGWGFH